MKERPILFKAEMVRAILDGSKTQTRRVMKPQPDDDAIIAVGEIGTSRGAAFVRYPREGGITRRVPCPYGQPGDRLWVRETYFGNHVQHPNEPEDERELHYRADGLPNFEGEESLIKWRPSIFMPRWASRITLEIVNVRVERLQDISEEDARAEGVGQVGIETGQVLESGAPVEIGSYACAYCDLWESINGKGSWEANPWVWVVEFKRTESQI